MTIKYSNQNRKNYIINGGFDIWQRGTSQTSYGYGCADRWNNVINGTTRVVSQQSFAPDQIDVSGNPRYFLRTVVSSVTGSSNYAATFQAIENVTLLSNEIITISFWAKSDASRNIATEMYQKFSVSSAISGINIVTHNLTTSWQKFTYNMIVPSVSGKTLDDSNALILVFWFDAGSDLNSRTNSLGQQSGTFDIAQVQVEKGIYATEFEKRSLELELMLCYRYYEQFNVAYKNGPCITYTPNGDTRGMLAYFKETKRIVPTVTLSTYSWIGPIGLSSSNEIINQPVTVTINAVYKECVKLNTTAGDLSSYGTVVYWSASDTCIIYIDAEL